MAAALSSDVVPFARIFFASLEASWIETREDALLTTRVLTLRSSP
jgi:hypothetical protein